MSDKKKDPTEEIDWYGNEGYYYTDPGAKESIECGVCGSTMKAVERNMFGPTSWAESVARSKHLHDVFKCPHLQEEWHKIIRQLKVDVYLAQRDDRGDKNIIKKRAERKIRKLLANHLKA